MSIDPVEAAMDCNDFERGIDAYLDGEFDEREQAEASAHLSVCGPCRGLLERTSRLRTALRTRLQAASAATAPQALRDRIREGITRERRPLWRRALSPVPISTLAACAAGALVVLVTHGPEALGKEGLVEEAIRYHHRALPLEVDAAALPGWFAGKLDFRPAPPHFGGTEGIRVQGARLSNIREWPAAYIRYQLPRGQAGLFIVDDPAGRFEASGREVQVGPQVVRVVNARGYNVAIWREDEIVYSLVSDLGEDDLFQLVRAARTEPGR